MRMQEAMASLGASKVVDLSAILSAPGGSESGGTAMKARPAADNEPKARLG